MKRLTLMAVLVLVATSALALESTQYANQPLWVSDWGWATVASGDSVTWDLTSVVAEKITVVAGAAGSLYIWNSNTDYPAPTKAWRFDNGDVTSIPVKDPDSLKVWIIAGTTPIVRYITERR